MDLTLNDDSYAATRNQLVMNEVGRMLDHRGVPDENLRPCGDDLEITAATLWSFCRADITVIAFDVLNKAVAKEVVPLLDHVPHLIVVWRTKQTPDAVKELSGFANIEEWNYDDLIHNPFNYGYLDGAGIVVETDAHHHLHIDKLMVHGGMRSLKRIHKKNPVRRYLNAKAGDIMWVRIYWGKVEATTEYRVAWPLPNEVDDDDDDDEDANVNADS